MQVLQAFCLTNSQIMKLLSRNLTFLFNCRDEGGPGKAMPSVTKMNRFCVTLKINEIFEKAQNNLTSVEWWIEVKNKIKKLVINQIRLKMLKNKKTFDFNFILANMSKKRKRKVSNSYLDVINQIKTLIEERLQNLV